MIKWKLKELLVEYQYKTGRALHYDEIRDDTGISPNTLSIMATGKTKSLNVRTLDKLLVYLSDKLNRHVAMQDLVVFEHPAPPTTPAKRRKGE